MLNLSPILSFPLFLSFNRQYLLDAIAYCGTSTCVSFVRDVIVDGELQGERVNIFLQSIALVAETSKDMVRDVLEIVKKQPSRQAYLTLGTLMSRHCTKTPKDCEFVSSILLNLTFFKALLRSTSVHGVVLVNDNLIIDNNYTFQNSLLKFSDFTFFIPYKTSSNKTTQSVAES